MARFGPRHPARASRWVCAPALVALLASAVHSASSNPPALRASADKALQVGLERTLGRLGLGGAVASQRLAVALVDLSGDDGPRLAMVNGDHMMYAASLPKIAILLGAFVQAERGNLVLDEPTLASLHSMIRDSSNTDANAILARVGENALLDILTCPRYLFYDPPTGGGLWVGKPYGKAPAYRRDPRHGLSHGATAFQVARFYYLLERGQLVSPELTRQMKAALAEPGRSHKFVKGLESRPEAHLFRKSGTWRHFHSDSALVEGDDAHFVLVGIAEDRRGGLWLERIAAPLHDLVSH